jgi:two-component system chemotaxis sensor kinase CheA
MDRNLTEMITDPLTHLIRNAIDHGIEKRETRLERGKPEVGIISVSARQQSGRIVIEIRDDGGGIDRTKVIAKARSNGIISQDRNEADISDKEAFGFIFAAGFSTAEKVTDVSGRGVGLDVVKTNIQKMKGTIDIESQLGKGTLFRLSLPLTTSITEGILAEAAGRKFILPLDRMRELIQARDIKSLSFSSGSRVVRVRDHMIPYLSLNEALCNEARSEDRFKDSTLVVMETATTLVAVAVDRVLSQTQVVLKPLDRTFKEQPEISGATILGDGSVALVLDIDGLLAVLSQPGARASFAQTTIKAA